MKKRNGKPDRISKSEVFFVAADKRFLPSGGISKAGMKRYAAKQLFGYEQAAKRIAHSRLTTGGIRPEKSVYTLDKAKMQRKGV